VQICRENGVEIAGKVPFDVSITKAMVTGVPVVETGLKTDAGEAIERMWARINQSNCLTTNHRMFKCFRIGLLHVEHRYISAAVFTFLHINHHPSLRTYQKSFLAAIYVRKPLAVSQH